MFKKIFGIVLFLVVIGVCFGLYMWYKPFDKAKDAKGIPITAIALSTEYNANEKTADIKYLNKVIEVSGVINEIDTNQDGGLMIILQAGDPTQGIQCTMSDKGVAAAKGQNITIKGFCSGNGITGVSLTRCDLK